MTERTQENFNKIKIKPNLFKDYLEKIGFKLMTTITKPQQSVAGEQQTTMAMAMKPLFTDEKPLLVYQKVPKHDEKSAITNSSAAAVSRSASSSKKK